MNKEKLIEKILEKVKVQLERNILEQFEKFKIVGEVPGNIDVESFDTMSNCKNNSTFEFNWYN